MREGERLGGEKGEKVAQGSPVGYGGGGVGGRVGPSFDVCHSGLHFLCLVVFGCVWSYKKKRKKKKEKKMPSQQNNYVLLFFLQLSKNLKMCVFFHFLKKIMNFITFQVCFFLPLSFPSISYPFSFPPPSD